MTRAWRLALRVFGRDWPLLLLDGGLVVANSARPGLAAILTARFVDALVAGRGVLPWVGAWVALQTMEELTNVLGNGLVQGRLAARAGLRVREMVLRRASGVQLIGLQGADFHDRLVRAAADLPGRLDRWMRTGMWMLNAGLSTAGAVIALLALGAGPWLPAALVAAAAVGIWVSGRLTTAELRQSRDGARPARLAGAWAGLLTSRHPAPEVRLFGVAAWVRERWAQAYRDGANVDLEAADARLRWGGVEAAAGLGAQVTVLALAAGAAVAAGPARGAGVFAGVLTGAMMVRGYFGMTVGALGGLGRHARVIDDLAQVLFEGDAEGRTREVVPVAASSVWRQPAQVACEGVTFRYPAAASDALRGTTMSVAPGEVVALVGPNGAGKSTLAAVLLGLYAPSGGSAVVGLPAGAVLQDFARYTLMVRDNVGFGDLPRLADDAALRAALGEAGSALASAPLDDWLGSAFGGRDLSGGEWLRVAIARGVVGRRPFLVLDEPTAAIDPVAEVALVRRLLEVARGRAAVVVSHRLGVARMANRILVMEGGRVTEQGAHEALLTMGGLYARMWRAQAAWYAAPGEPARPE